MAFGRNSIELGEPVCTRQHTHTHTPFTLHSVASPLQAEKSPFVERLLTKGYEVLYFVDPVDEYTIQTLPEFEGKKFQNVAKEGLEFADEAESAKEKLKELQETYQPLTDWLKDQALSDVVEKAVVSNRLVDSPCALVASQYGWYVGVWVWGGVCVYRCVCACMYTCLCMHVCVCLCVCVCVCKCVCVGGLFVDLGHKNFVLTSRSGNMERIMRAQAYAAGKDSNTEYVQTDSGGIKNLMVQQNGNVLWLLCGCSVQVVNQSIVWVLKGYVAKMCCQSMYFV